MRVFARTPLDLDQIRVPAGRIYIIPERCKGCELCVHFCPRAVLIVSEETNAKGYHYPDVQAGKEAECVHCEFCTMICPEFAIYTKASEAKPL